MADQTALLATGVLEGEDRKDPGGRGILLCIALVSAVEICAAAAWLLW